MQPAHWYLDSRAGLRYLGEASAPRPPPAELQTTDGQREIWADTAQADGPANLLEVYVKVQCAVKLHPLVLQPAEINRRAKPRPLEARPRSTGALP